MSEDWVPELSDTSAPIYRSIVDAIKEDVARQRLWPGMRMPTHRSLAEKLGVNVGTVTRAYIKARDLGLLSGEIGRGTFVSIPKQSANMASGTPGVIDLMLNKPVAIDDGAFFRKTLQQIAEGYSVAPFMEYPQSTGSEAHRIAGVKLASLTGVTATPDQIVITNGAQQGLMASLSVYGQPGDVIATEALNYTGIRSLAEFLRLRILPIEIDERGMVPDSFERACQRERIAALVVTPSIHNPTTATLDLERRKAIAAIGARYGVPIVENDVYGALVKDPIAPIYTLAEATGCYICGVSKLIASGIRVGYVVAPRDRVGAITNAIHATTWTVAPLLAELVSQWMHDGTTVRVIEAHRGEIRRRQEIARNVLGEGTFHAHPQSYHIWLPLPAPWRQHEFTDACLQNGVAVTSGAIFAINSTYAPNAVRISLGAQRDIEVLKTCLSRVAQTLKKLPALGMLMI